jgi:signal transduction histidine kinase
MVSADITSPSWAIPRRFMHGLTRLRLPLRTGRFWLVQAGVLLVAVLDEVVLDFMHVQPPFEIPRSTVTALLLVPVIYAAVNFGVQGGVGTSLWATALMIPDWLFIGGVTTATAWVEVGNMVILNGVAIIVGQRVDREGNARLRVQAYAAHLLTVQEDERRTLAQDLHDDPVQTLTYLVRMLEVLGENPRLPPDLAPMVLRDGELAADVVKVLRTVIYGLRPPVLDDLGTVAALRQLVAEVRSRHGIAIRLQVTGDQVRLSDRCELAVYRVAQEALSNVVRHAQATQAHVDLSFGDQVVLTVTDDGRGIFMPGSQAGTAARVGGLGLIGMRERISLVGGTLEVRACKPRGTLVRATVPGGQAGLSSLS